MLVNTITILTWRKERYKSLSLWKCKELPIWTTTSITFPFLNEKPFSFDSIIPTTKLTCEHDNPRWGHHVDFESNCYQSSLLVRSPSNSVFYRSVRVSNKAIENLLLRFIMKIRHTSDTYSKNSSTLITRYSESDSHRMSARASVVIWQLERVSVGSN